MLIIRHSLLNVFSVGGSLGLLFGLYLSVALMSAGMCVCAHSLSHSSVLAFVSKLHFSPFTRLSLSPFTRLSLSLSFSLSQS